MREDKIRQASKRYKKYLSSTARITRQDDENYESWAGHKPDKVTPVKANIGKMLEVGDMLGVIYRAPDGNSYLHEFQGEQLPLLFISADGRTAMFNGGFNFKFKGFKTGFIDKG